ncbi:MAG: DUF2334 domain-containing protein [Deltaproteobacteria bacterium]|nr:DUF2334 domain-containing protein [Deltaproteobacteria bacterium]
MPQTSTDMPAPARWLDGFGRAAQQVARGPRWPERQTLVSLHDVSPAHDEVVFRSIEHLRSKGVDALTLLVVPDYHMRADLRHHRDFCKRLKRALGPRDEVALHGFYHLADRAPATAAAKLAAATLTAGEGEFQALDYPAALQRIQQGLHVIEETLDLRPQGFVAPAWLQNDAVVRAVRAAGLQWCEDHLLVCDVQSGQQILAPALSMASRDPVRRLGSVATASLGSALLPALRTVRLAVHPGDYAHQPLVAALDGVLDRWLVHHPPVTLREIWPCTSAS